MSRLIEVVLFLAAVTTLSGPAVARQQTGDREKQPASREIDSPSLNRKDSPPASGTTKAAQPTTGASTTVDDRATERSSGKESKYVRGYQQVVPPSTPEQLVEVRRAIEADQKSSSINSRPRSRTRKATT